MKCIEKLSWRVLDIYRFYSLSKYNCLLTIGNPIVTLTKMNSRSMCAAHILRSTQHTCRVHMCKMCTNCTHAYKICAACICFVCVHIVTTQTYAAGCMCANCTLYAHFILCTDSRKFNLAPSNSTNIHFTSSLISIAMKLLDK